MPVGFIHELVVACLVHNECNDVLLVKHHRRGWEIPVGRVENGEALLNAVKREVTEESGINILVHNPVAFHSKVDDKPALVVVFEGESLGGKLRTSDETVEVGWFKPADAFKLVEHPASKDRIRDALSYNGTVIHRSYTISPYRSQII